MGAKRGVILLACLLAGNAVSRPATQDAEDNIAHAVSECQRLHGTEDCHGEAFVPTAEEALRGAAKYHARMAQDLATSGDPRDLALAVVLGQAAADQQVFAKGRAVVPRGDAMARRWWQDAFDRSGGDVLAQTLLVHAAKAGMQDRRRLAVQRWRALEPDNLAAWMASDAPVNGWLSSARSTTRYDSHAYARLRWMAERLQAFPPTSEEVAALAEPLLTQPGTDPRQDATIAALGIWLAEWQPGYQALIAACRGDALSAAPDRASDCRHVAGVLAETSDITIAQGIGLAMLEHTATNDEERAQAMHARRRFHWQMYMRGEIAGEDPAADFTQFLRLLDDPAVRSERDLATRLLADAGVPADPPSGWRSPWLVPAPEDGAARPLQPPRGSSGSRN